MGLRFVFGCGTSGADAFCFRFSCGVHFVSPDRVAVVTIHHSGWEKQQGNSSTTTSAKGIKSNRAGSFPFLCTRQNEDGLFTRGVPFAGSPANHTYIQIIDPALAIDLVLQGGPSNRHNPITHPNAPWGVLVGYMDPVIPGQTVGTLRGTNPATNEKLLTDTGADACSDVLQLRDDVKQYDSGPSVKYASLSNGTTTFNSNSFTFTLLNQIHLSTLASLVIGWSPGWGQLVPGL